jgi:hypothetical protein
MINILLTIACLSGFFYAAQGLKIKPEFSPLFSVSFIGIFLYFFAVYDHLELGSAILIYSGLFLCLFVIGKKWKNRKSESIGYGVWPVFMVLLAGGYLLAKGMAFTVIDDYVYWGVIGKYLYLNDHLPVTGNPLDIRILAYTPGTGLIHYFFYSLFNTYSPDISYFAQSIILTSALVVVVQKDNIKKTIIYISLLILLLSVFFGSVYTKLQVDYLLAAVLFSLFWMYRSQENQWVKLLTISMPVCFLFLIKEIGFVFGVFVLILIACDTLSNSHMASKDKRITALMLFATGLGLFSLRLLWTHHFQTMGFEPLHKGIHFDSIKKTFLIYSDPSVQKGFIIYLKALLFESADRLNLPYLIWYAGVTCLVLKLIKQTEKNDRRRVHVFLSMVFILCGVYLLMLYFLQIIMFKVGITHDYTVGFARYWNIWFCPIVFIAVICFCHQILLKTIDSGKKTVWIMLFITILVLCGSRIEVSLKREKQDIHVENISRQISTKIDDKNHSIGVISGGNDHLVGLKLLYYLLPHNVDYRFHDFKNAKQLIHYAKQYDYVIVYHPDPEVIDWINPFLSDSGLEGGVHLLKIITEPSGHGLSEKKIFEKVLF